MLHDPGNWVSTIKGREHLYPVAGKRYGQITSPAPPSAEESPQMHRVSDFVTSWLCKSVSTYAS